MVKKNLKLLQVAIPIILIQLVHECVVYAIMNLKYGKQC